MNKDVLETDLEVWNNRLADIWNDHPVDLFDLAMADTVKKYPGQYFNKLIIVIGNPFNHFISSNGIFIQVWMYSRIAT